ncbi:glycosyltransferase family 4 protein [Salinicoccus luteus]|uniref:glycosyltransferase family 4 protein n=1 Tax=Salinicoccus luteus TaxID=367840 RepID=UPI0004E228AF|nr:glycosyltransferase family 4 protein [Salinicoccus luteus]
MIYKMNDIANRLRKTKEMKPLIEKGIEYDHPLRHLFITAALNNNHFTGNTLRKNLSVQKNAIILFNSRQYEEAWSLIKGEEDSSLLPLKVKVLVQLKKWDEIIQLYEKDKHILRMLTSAEEKRLTKGMLQSGLHLELEHLLRASSSEHYLIREQLINSVINSGSFPKTSQNITEYQADFEYGPESFITSLKIMSPILKERIFLFLLDTYRNSDKYMKTLIELLSDYMEKHPYLDKYLYNLIPDHLSLFGNRVAELDGVLNNLKRYSNENEKGFHPLMRDVEDYINKYDFHEMLIIDIRKLILRQPKSLEMEPLIRVLKMKNSSLALFMSPDFILSDGIRDLVDEHVYTNYNYFQRKRIYNQLIPALMDYNGEMILPLHIHDYLLRTRRRKIQNYYILSRSYENGGKTKALHQLMEEKAPSTRLRIWLYLARFFYQEREFTKSLKYTKEAENLYSTHPDVLRSFIRSYNVQGDISKKKKYIDTMEKHHPEKLLTNESRYVLQEMELLDQPWKMTTEVPSVETTGSKKVMYVLNKAYPVINGYTVRSYEMIKRVGTLGVEPVVVTKLGWHPSDEGYNPKDSERAVKTHYIGKSQKYPLTQTPLMDYFDAYTQELIKVISKEKPGMIHAASNFQNALPALELGKKMNIHTVYEVRGLWHYTHVAKNRDFYNSERFQLENNLEIHCCEIADKVLCISESLKHFLVQHGIEEEKITVLPNGVDTTHLKPEPISNDLKQRLGLEDSYVLGFIGSLTSYEGIEMLIDALKEINEKQLAKRNMKLMIVGGGYYEATLKEYVDSQGMSQYVKFTGRVSREEIARHYALIDLCPFPRTNEKVCHLVTPLKTYEAMAMEKTVLVSDVAALQEMVEPGVNGHIFEADSKKSLVNAILDAINQKDIGKAAREWVVNHREWDKLILKLQPIYE